MTRRQLLAGAAAGRAFLKTTAAAAQSRAENPPKPPRLAPSICLYSQVLLKVPYDELGPVLKSLEVDGCDLAVFPGSHIRAEHLDLDVERAIEAITGVGLDVPVLTTNYTSLSDNSIRTVAGFASEMGIPLFRAGHWKYPPSAPVEARLVEVQRDMGSLAALARMANMAVAIPNVPGEVGGSIWDTYIMIRGMDARTIGYDYDAGYAAEAGGLSSDVALRLALPRIKMVTARDFYWTKESGAWKRVACPLGEGMVDWPTLFKTLAAARFAGPVSVTVDYQPADDLAAVRHDVAFLRKQVAAAYAG